MKRYAYILIFFILIFSPQLLIGKVITISKEDISKMSARNIYDLFSKIPELYTYTFGGTGQKVYVKRFGFSEGNIAIYLDGFLLSSQIIAGVCDGRTDLSSLDIEYLEKVIIDLNSSEGLNGKIELFTKNNFNSDKLIAEILYKDAFYNHRDMSFLVSQQYNEETAFSLFTDVTDYQDDRERNDFKFKNPYHKERIEFKLKTELFDLSNYFTLKYLREKTAYKDNNNKLKESNLFTFEHRLNLIKKIDFNLQILSKLEEKRLISNKVIRDSLSSHLAELGLVSQYKGFSTYMIDFRSRFRYEDYFSLKQRFNQLKLKLKVFSNNNDSFLEHILNSGEITYSIGSKGLEHFGINHKLFFPLGLGFELVNNNRYLQGRYYSNFNSLPDTSSVFKGIAFQSKSEEHNLYLDYSYNLNNKKNPIIISFSAGVDYCKLSDLKGNGFLISKKGDFYYSNVKGAILFGDILSLNSNYYKSLQGSSIYSPSYTIASDLSYCQKFIYNELIVNFGVHHRFSDYDLITKDNIYQKNMKVNNLNFYASVTILDFEIFFGSDNLLDNKFNFFDEYQVNLNDHHIYQTIGGYDMPKRDEIWGVRWIFKQ